MDSSVLAVVGGATGAAAVSGITTIWKFYAERRAKKKDMAEDKADVTEQMQSHLAETDGDISALNVKVDALSEALMLMMQDRIINLGTSYINRGSVSFTERKLLRSMHDCYHNKLGGNGDCNLIMESVDSLPLK